MIDTLMDPIIVIVGNPVDGLSLYGPFTTVEEAIEWAIREQQGKA